MPLTSKNHSIPHSVDLHHVVDMALTTLDAYDTFTFEHSYRVSGLSEIFAEALNLSLFQSRIIQYAAYMHDVGMICVPNMVLNKTEPLTTDEMKGLQTHPIVGFNILSRAPELNSLARIIRHHHERWDGLGYPDGLSGTNIPMESRVIGIIDAFDAMTSNRGYRPQNSHEWALEEIKNNTGSQFCPHCSEVFLSLRSKIKASQYHSTKRAATVHSSSVTDTHQMCSRKVIA